MDYDSMEGLEYGDGGTYGGLFDFIMDAEMRTQALTVAVAGGAGILAGTYGVNWLMDNVEFLKPADATNEPYVRSGLQLGIGLLAGGALYSYAQANGGDPMMSSAAMGVLGGLSALAVANVLNGMLGANKVSGLTGVPEDDSSLLSEYSDEFDGVAALSALEATGVSTAAGAFADPSVTNEALMGTMVQQEDLGAYQPYMA